MYSKRQKLYKEQTYREVSPSEPEAPEVERQRSASATVERQRSQSVATTTTHIPSNDRPINRAPVVYAPKPVIRQRIDGMVYRPIEVGYRTQVVTQGRLEDGYEQAQYELELRRTIPKKVDWQLMSEDARNQLRTILRSTYQETIKSMKEEADSVEETQIESQAETVLKPIVRQIDKSLRLTLLPDPVDIKLLNTELYQEIDDMEGKLQADLKLTAELSLKIEERSSLLTDRKEELDDLKLKNRLAKEKLANLAGSAFNDDPEDYVQMLTKYPSSNDY